jgi:hypothetical protein
MADPAAHRSIHSHLWLLEFLLIELKRLGQQGRLPKGLLPTNTDAGLAGLKGCST